MDKDLEAQPQQYFEQSNNGVEPQQVNQHPAKL
jgi:hypothetical protein